MVAPAAAQLGVEIGSEKYNREMADVREHTEQIEEVGCVSCGAPPGWDAELIERIEALEKACAESTSELSHYLADQTIFRSELIKELGKFHQRISRLEERDIREEGFQHDIEDREELIAEMQDTVQKLPARVAFLEECVEGLEQLFKLRRHKPRPLDQRVS